MELLNMAFKALQVLAPDSPLSTPDTPSSHDHGLHEVPAPFYGISIPGSEDEETQWTPALTDLTA